MVPSTKIVLIGPCLMIVHYTVHFAGWSDVSMTLFGFSEAQKLVFYLLMNPSWRKWDSSQTTVKGGRVLQHILQKSPNRTHISTAC